LRKKLARRLSLSLKSHPKLKKREALKRKRRKMVRTRDRSQTVETEVRQINTGGLKPLKKSLCTSLFPTTWLVDSSMSR
jgi:hypothetical protein